MTHRRVLSLTCSLLLGFALVPPCPADDPPDKPLAPKEAAKRPKERVTVCMEVKSATKGDGTFRLNSEKNPRSDKNFTLLLTQQGAEKFREAKVRDPAEHFRGKTMLATGIVRVAQGRAIIVSDLAQIKLAGDGDDNGGDKKD